MMASKRRRRCRRKVYCNLCSGISLERLLESRSTLYRNDEGKIASFFGTLFVFKKNCCQDVDGCEHISDQLLEEQPRGRRLGSPDYLDLVGSYFWEKGR